MKKEIPHKPKSKPPLINRLFMFALVGTRPLLGPATCRYRVGCTKFALQQLQEQNLFVALWRITKRVLSCNPFTRIKENK